MATALAVITGGVQDGRGKPSYAALALRTRVAEGALADMRERLDEADAELRASSTERSRFAADVVALARRGQMALAAGYRPTQQLVELEQHGVREMTRARSMQWPGGTAA